MKRVFIRGDNHGDVSFLDEFCRLYNTTKDDALIILGDAGFNYYGPKSKKEKAIKESAAKYPISIFCVRGNHEDRPKNRNMKKEQTYCGPISGLFYFEEEYPNIYYTIDGETYWWDDKSIYVIGGAYSIDKFYRLEMGWNWFPEEQLSDEEKEKISKETAGQHYNYILSHTCPFSWQPVDLFLQGVYNTDESTERWLESVEREVGYDHWYFGHFHDDRFDITGDGRVNMLFNKIVQLEI